MVLCNSNRSGGEKAGPLIWGRQFIFSTKVIFKVFGNFWRFWVEDFGGSGWRLFEVLGG